MKIYFKTSPVDLSTNSVGPVLANYELKIEGQLFKLGDLMPLFKYFKTGVSDATSYPVVQYNIWIDFAVEIQAVFDETGSQLPFEYLTDNREVIYQNFAVVTVNEFQQGKNYLIPFSAATVTDICPEVTSFVISGTQNSNVLPLGSGTHKYYDETIASNYYTYTAPSKQQVRNGVSFNGIMFDVSRSQLISSVQRTSLKRTQLNERIITSLND